MARAFAYLRSQSVRSLLYAAAFLTVFGLAIVILIWSLLFLARLIDSINVTSEEEPIPVSVFNLTDFALISRKLGITLPAEPPRQPSPPPAPASPAGGPPPPPVATETPVVSEPEPVPAATTSQETPPPAPGEISLQLLNGTSITGLAKVWQGKFEDAGFQGITIGNAAQRDYSGVEITTRPSKKEILTVIRATLTQYGVSEDAVREITGSEEGEYDVVIILGK